MKQIYTFIIICWSMLAFGQEFSAVQFGAAEDYISTEWKPDFGATQDFSIDFSVKTSGWSSDPVLVSTKDWGSGTNAGFNIALASGGNGIDVNVGDGSNRADLDAGAIADDKWHHILVSADRDGLLSLYIDGDLVQTTDMSAVGDINTELPFNMGQDGTGTYSAAASAAITNLKVWNKVMTFEEIESTVCGQIDPSMPILANLLRYYAMQEGTGTTVADVNFSGSVKNGTLEGNAAWIIGEIPTVALAIQSEIAVSTVSFSAESDGVTKYKWDFGDGNTSTEANPVHTYAEVGVYTVQLVGSNVCNAVTVTSEIVISEVGSDLITSANFDGSNQIKANNTFGANDDFTIEAYVRSNGWNADPGIVSNKDWASGSNDGFILAARSDGKGWKFNAGDGSNRLDMDGGDINDGVWHHIAVSYDHDGRKAIFQDGVLLDESDTMLEDIDTELDLFIGVDGSESWAFNGQIAEVRVWSSALSDEVIIDNYCKVTESHPEYNQLKHYWKLNEGTGNTVVDLIGANNGTFNGTWTSTPYDLQGCTGINADADFNAVAFNSNTDYINTSFEPSYGTDGDFSIEFRIKTNGWSGDPAILSDKDWGSGTNAGINIALASDGSGIDVNVGDGTNRADLASGNISDGEWHQVLVTADRDGLLSMYIDGALTESTNMSEVGDINSPFAFKMGQDGTGSYSNAATAELSEVRIWNTIIPENVAAEYRCYSIDDNHPNYSDLAHYWPLSEGEGTTAADMVTSANAELQGETKWTMSNNFAAANSLFSSSVVLSTVSFTNLSTPGNYFWDFGDGNTSTTKDPSHTYLATGTFPVTLRVTTACSAKEYTTEITVNQLNQNLIASLDFDGEDDAVTLQNSINDLQDFTIELLVKTSGWNGDPGMISNKDWGSGKNAGMILAARSDGEGWKLNVGDGENRIDLDGGIINDDKWHHIAASYDADGLKRIYQDGALVAESSEQIGSIASDLPLIIGMDGAQSYKFRGQIAQVRVWSKALDSLTIVSNICGADEEHPDYDALLHYWKLDEGDGTVINDASGTNVGAYNGSWIVTSNNIESCIPKNSFDIGSGNAISFDAVNDWIDCSGNNGDKVSAASLNLPEESMTLEAWVKPRSYKTWTSIVSFIQDNGSFEKGWDMETRDGNKFAFALSTVGGEGGLQYMETQSSFNENEWYHIAGTYDGATMKLYINGVLEAESNNQNGMIDYADSWLALGIYKDDNEAFTLNGELDEVRIYSRAKSADEIRNTMCQKLEGDEDGLVVYYRLDNITGELVKDNGPNGRDGLMQDMNPVSARVLSGAPIGDRSAHLFADDFSSTSLSLDLVDATTVTLDEMNGFADGLFIYATDEAPGSKNGVLSSQDDPYYGVFFSGSRGLTAKASYDITANEAAVASSSINLYNRSDASIQTWFASGANREANELIIGTLASRREFVLGDYEAASCAAPSGFEIQNAAFSSADINWNGNAMTYNVRIADVNGAFDTIQNNYTTDVSSFSVSGLNAAATYSLYVQGVCADGSVSAWVGPVSFNTLDPCPRPESFEVMSVEANVVTLGWDSPESTIAWQVEWGPKGYVFGTGILTDTDQNPFELKNLPFDTEIDIYLRANCTDYSLTSDWIGPIPVATGSVSTEDQLQETIKIYPNPARNMFFLDMGDIKAESVNINDMYGRQILRQSLQDQSSKIISLNLEDVPAGNYIISISGSDGLITKPLIKL